jgi:hypothetical protein
MPGRKYQLDITGPCHGGNLNSTLPGRHHGDNISSSPPGRYHGGNISSSPPGRYHGGNISSASPDLCLGIRMSSTSPGLATVVTRCTTGVSCLPLASPWRHFPTRAGRFQGCTFGDSAPLRSLAIVLAVGSRRYRMANRLRLVRSITPARRSCDLVRVNDAVKFDGSVRVDDEVGERWQSRWKTFSSAPGEKR